MSGEVEDQICSILDGLQRLSDGSYQMASKKGFVVIQAVEYHCLHLKLGPVGGKKGTDSPDVAYHCNVLREGEPVIHRPSKILCTG